MSLFSNRKKPCPICGCPTPNYSPEFVDGLPICADCSYKLANLPEEKKSTLTQYALNKYMNYYSENRLLRQAFTTSYVFDCDGFSEFPLAFDYSHRLFRIGNNPDSIVFLGSEISGYSCKLENDKLNVTILLTNEWRTELSFDIPSAIISSRTSVLSELDSAIEIVRQTNTAPAV